MFGPSERSDQTPGSPSGRLCHPSCAVRVRSRSLRCLDSLCHSWHTKLGLGAHIYGPNSSLISPKVACKVFNRLSGRPLTSLTHTRAGRDRGRRARTASCSSHIERPLGPPRGPGTPR
ncbi:uncharacterized protein LOC113208276 [Frankliniella occidentalis]|uniref:Uncharacterized protein LOC113208276 n=1 Tax=Frankliniella occidentalis TaxID=133901 RepID=A0A9C6U3L1_FRAOC|nr:uncharacterized protein LOC113208276 [Frankliniella occidentalis]